MTRVRKLVAGALMLTAATVAVTAPPAQAALPQRPAIAETVTPNYVATWGWISGTVYFNIPETLSIANGWGGVGVFTAACGAVGALAGPVGTAVAAASCAAQAATIVYTASVAYHSDPSQCLKIRILMPGGVLYPGKYNRTDSRCRWYT